MRQVLLIIVSTLALALAVAANWFMWSYLYRLWRDWHRQSENGERPKIKLDIKRAFWPFVVGSMVALFGSIEGIRAIDDKEFLSSHVWLFMTTLGALLVVRGAMRGLKIN